MRSFSLEPGPFPLTSALHPECATTPQSSTPAAAVEIRSSATDAGTRGTATNVVDHNGTPVRSIPFIDREIAVSAKTYRELSRHWLFGQWDGSGGNQNGEIFGR